MKKLIFCILISYLQYSFFSYCWEVRVIPVNRDTMTGQWNGLFGHDIARGWSDFRQQCFDEKEIPNCIMQMMQKQTNGAYTLSAQQIEKIKSCSRMANGDIVYCIPVNYVSAPHLHKRMEESHERNLTKDKFAWIPIDEVLRHRTVVKIVRGRASLFVFDFNTRTTIKEFWPKQLLPELNAGDPKKPYQVPQSEIVKKYLDAKKNKGDIAVKPRMQMRTIAAQKISETAKDSKVAMVKGISPQISKPESVRTTRRRHSLVVG